MIGGKNRWKQFKNISFWLPTVETVGYYKAIDDSPAFQLFILCPVS
jgi:hypothetical protein